MNLKGKTCLVTGGASGIGKSIVEGFVKAGADKVYAADINADALAEISKAHEVVEGLELNVTKPEQISAAAERFKEQDINIDVLVNNAGITRDGLVQKMSDEDWDAVININLKGVFNMTRVFGPMMMRQGAGSIVTIASIVGLDGNVGQTNYSATKAGVIGMSKTWAKEFARKGAQVRANVVAPGFINTPMIKTVPQKMIDALVERTTLQRLGEVEDVANAVTFLASDASAFVTGQVLRVDGGLIL